MIEDPYVYKNTFVLKNKDGIRSKEKLEQLEESIVTIRIIMLKNMGLKITSIYDAFKIHEFLFTTIFTWAGEPRTIDIYKSEAILEGKTVDYTPASYIEPELQELENKFQKINWMSLDNNEKIEKVADIVQELWQIHCFREGNTRTIAMFLYFLLKTLGMHINTGFIAKNSKYFRNAVVLASIYSLSNKTYLIEIIKDTVAIKIPNSDKYKSINGYDVEKYNYNEHTIERLKTIKSYKDA